MLTLFLILLSFIILRGLSERPESSVVVFEKGEGGYYCHKIPYLFETVTGTLVALAEARGGAGREACDDFSGTDLVIKRSDDGGQTWSPLAVLVSNSSAEDVNIIGNAAPIVQRDTNRIHIPFCRNNEESWYTYSDDDGLTWAPWVLLPQAVQPDWKWVGLGPPGGLQLNSGRLLVSGYHTTKVKGDGELSRGHTLISDDLGVSWRVGAESIGGQYRVNENQAVQLGDGSVLLNARTLTPQRVQATSHDGGESFPDEEVLPAVGLTETVEGCEGSLFRWSCEDDADAADVLYYSGVANDKLVRRGMWIYVSEDSGVSWRSLQTVDAGAVAYSSLASSQGDLVLLYERSDSYSLVFEPDQIVFYRVGALPLL